MKRWQDDYKDEERVTASLAGLAVILFLAVALFFVIEKLRAISEIQDCLMQGRTNCLPMSSNGSEKQ